VLEHLLGSAAFEHGAVVQEADRVGDVAGELHLVGGDQLACGVARAAGRLVGCSSSPHAVTRRRRR
jgi:hypothetical protein